MHNCVGEYPVRLSVNYKDANGQKHRWAWGFLTGPNPNKLTNYDIVTPREWYNFTSQNLMALEPRPSVITSISLAGAGWNYHGQVDNVEIINDEQ